MRGRNFGLSLAFAGAVIAVVGGQGGGGGSSKISVTGVVTQGMGEPVVGAKVEDLNNPGTSAVTGSDGTFTLKAVTTAAKSGRQLLLQTTKDGFAPQLTSLPHKEGVATYNAPISVVAVQSMPLTPGQATTVDVSVYETAVRIQVAPVSTPGLRLLYAAVEAGPQAPGTMQAEEDTPSKSLQSGGIFYVDIVDAAGKSVSAPPNVQFAMSSFQMDDMEGAGPLQSYTMGSNGYWESTGQIGEPASGPVMMSQKFGYTNCDRSVPTACVVGSVAVQGASGSGAACAGGRISASGPGGFSSFDSSGPDGSFCVAGGKNRQSTLRIGGATTSAQMPDNWGDCSQPSTCATVGAIQVPASACGQAQQQQQNTTPGSDAGPASDCDGDKIGAAMNGCVSAARTCGNGCSECTDEAQCKACGCACASSLVNCVQGSSYASCVVDAEGCAQFQAQSPVAVSCTAGETVGAVMMRIISLVEIQGYSYSQC
ncbi:MAG: carboxypeptidase-like regulatory domain-containing protein [Polyangiaceae bacterium]|nr:carboxypeptidase-like regulatory domain-containing protein [Polyangiaceae bacterium]